MADLYEFGDRSSNLVLVQPVDEHDLGDMENEVAFIAEKCSRPFRLMAFKIRDWNKDLSPWEAPAVFGREDFGNGASGTLKEILELCSDGSKTYYIGGYSLAGLFALWAAYQTDVFGGVAAASPSIWFPGFTDYMRGHRILCGSIYLSLGKKEDRARNPVMATVGERIREAYSLLIDRDLNCELEWNEGNHFKDPGIRTAKAFVWLLDKASTD